MSCPQDRALPRAAPPRGARTRGARTRALALVALVALAALAGTRAAPRAAAAEPDAAQAVTDREARAPRPASPAAPPAIVAPSFADIAARLDPAIVSVATTDDVAAGRGRSDVERFEWFFGPRRRGPGAALERESSGSGFIISPDGYILTNQHVVEDGDGIIVELGDERSFTARLIGSDADTDVALLKIDADGPLPIVPLGDSDAVRVGEWVIAIGNPLFYDHTVTVGVISAKGRVLAAPGLVAYLQTDAAINFGNSGGPLVNGLGEAIGINTAISSQGQNIGFAVPINLARWVVAQLRQSGRVVRGYAGVQLDPVSVDMAETLGLERRTGVLVKRVEPGQPAALADLRPGDVILGVDSAPIDSRDAFLRSVASHAPGSTLRFDIFRERKRISVEITLGERPSASLPAAPAARARDAPLGFDIDELSEAFRSSHELDAGTRGVVVTAIDQDGPAAHEDLREDDVVIELNRKPVADVEAFRGLAAQIEPGSTALLYVERRNESFFLAIRTRNPAAEAPPP